MKAALATLVAGLLVLPVAIAQEESAPFQPFVDVAPLCRDGAVIGVQIITNVPVTGVVTWPANYCNGRST